MRSLNRHLVPQDFPANFTGQQRVDWELELLEAKRELQRGNIEKIDFTGRSSRWRDAKPNLLVESRNKCAYCEVNFTTVAYGDVEHYRPKSVYWWLAYSYHNYSASCQLCNQKYKKAKFPRLFGRLPAPIVRRNSTDTYLRNLAGQLSVDPLDDTAGIPISDFRDAHQDERPLSLDPYMDDPTQYFAYSYNDATREVLIESGDPANQEIVDSAVELFGLNRKELRDIRYRELLKYRALRQVIDAVNDPVVTQAMQNVIVSVFLDPAVEFLGMFRYFEGRPIDPVPPNL